MLKNHLVYRLSLCLKSLLVLLVICVTGCAKYQPRSEFGNGTPYIVLGVTYEVLDSSEGFKQTGNASWYGEKYHGHKTFSGEPYDMYAMTAAHPTLPIPTDVRVTNTENGRVVIVRINDRGPFNTDRVIDLSYAAAEQLGMLSSRSVNVEIVSLYSPESE